MENQTLKEYVHKLANRYVAYFDVYRDDYIGSIPLAFKALYKRRDERYLMTKTIKVWGVENQQAVFVSTSDTPVTQEFIHRFQNDMKDKVDQFVTHDKDHMSTILLGVIVTDQPVPEEVKKGVKNYRKIKWIRYGLHGWAELYIAVVDLKVGSVYVNPKAQSFVEPFQKLLTEEDKS
ncbi:hypothetical protein [Ammoniphilus sp. YIM 78166]|uniref:hypothetical protein n=1 Tax=Ammoniphilus sp. YIM 78166 TaxID=1644106 RepID=UPI00106FEF37|nr:hypothetical protein [Ammoniphilus sp. YIM 78166]